jgi:hypothetical protein
MMNELICAVYGALPYTIFIVVYVTSIYKVFDYYYFRK